MPSNPYDAHSLYNTHAIINADCRFNDALQADWSIVAPLDGGQFLYDLVGLNTGALKNMGNANSGWRNTAHPGRLAGSMLFDGSAAIVSVPDAPGVHLAGDFTISAMIYPGYVGTDTYMDVILKDGGVFDANSNYNFGVRQGNASGTNSGNRGFLYYRNASALGGLETSDNAMPPLVWTHLCGTYINATKTISLYANGLPVGSTSSAVAPVVGSGTVKIGGQTGPSNETIFAGNIDRLRINGRAFSAAEVMQYYRELMAGSPNLYNRVGKRFISIPPAAVIGHLLSLRRRMVYAQ